jgi:hypothetical protein
MEHSSDDSQFEKDSESASVLQIGEMFWDLAQFQELSSNKGWVDTDLSRESRSLVISDSCCFKEYSKKNEDAFEQLTESTLVVLCKYPGKQQFLMYSVQQWELFTVRYGRMPSRGAQSRLSTIVDKCLRIVQYGIDKGQVQRVNGFVLLSNQVSVCRNILLKDFLSRKVYDGPAGCKAMIELKSTWITDKTAPSPTLYPYSFEV